MKKEVASLLKFFLKERLEEEVDINLNFAKKEVVQEIGSYLYPGLARRGIWAIHSGGFHFKGGHLTVGPSNCGKSALSYMAMKNGFSLVSDDIALLRETPRGLEILPFYSTIFLKGKAINPEPKLFKPTILKYLLFPTVTGGSTFIRKIEKRVDLLRKLVPQFLWSYNKQEQEKQKHFVERLSKYPAFELHWGTDLVKDVFHLGKVLDEIVPG